MFKELKLKEFAPKPLKALKLVDKLSSTEIQNLIIKIKQLSFEETKCLFDVLPNILKLKILSYLRPSELCTMAQVTKNWKELSEHDELWVRLPKKRNMGMYGYWTTKSQYKDHCSSINSAIKEVQEIETKKMKKIQESFMAEINKTQSDFLNPKIDMSCFIERSFFNVRSPCWPSKDVIYNSVIKKDENGEDKEFGFILK